jgi:hypothetical protein
MNTAVNRGASAKTAHYVYMGENRRDSRRQGPVTIRSQQALLIDKYLSWSFEDSNVQESGFWINHSQRQGLSHSSSAASLDTRRDLVPRSRNDGSQLGFDQTGWDEVRRDRACAKSQHLNSAPRHKHRSIFEEEVLLGGRCPLERRRAPPRLGLQARAPPFRLTLLGGGTAFLGPNGLSQKGVPTSKRPGRTWCADSAAPGLPPLWPTQASDHAIHFDPPRDSAEYDDLYIPRLAFAPDSGQLVSHRSELLHRRLHHLGVQHGLAALHACANEVPTQGGTPQDSPTEMPFGEPVVGGDLRSLHLGGGPLSR